MIDETWYSNCNRLSPEAPVPVASLRQKIETLGGAANVAYNLRALVPDMKIYLGGWLGHTHQHLLSKEDIHLWPGGWLPENLTNVKLRIVDQSKGYHIVRVDNEEFINCEGRFLPCDEICKWIDEIQPDSIIFSDYLKGAITRDLAETLIDSKDQTEIFVDTRRSDISMFNNADWLTPNKHEYRKILDYIHIRQPLWRQTPEMVCGYAKLGGILLTRGCEGMDLFTLKETDLGKVKKVHLHEDSRNTDIIDVTGAGDTALATFAAIRTLGCKNHEIALRLANEIAGEVCMFRGTTAPATTLKEHGFEYNGHTEKKEE
jgi:rfaE bifunctional protein kinase chain/domain